MSSRHLASSDGGERSRAIQRLWAAVAEAERTRAQDVPVGRKPNDVETAASLRAADVEIAARERWLKLVDDSDY
jgi:predicted nucleic acid-binding Zn ribbon protein